MIYFKSKVFIILIILCTSLNAYKILGLFPHPAISHFHFFHPILRGLADAGHDVTVFGHFPDKNAPANYHDKMFPGEVLTSAISFTSDWFMNRRKYGHYYELKFAYDWGYIACQYAYNSTDLQHILKTNEKFDVILMEHFNTDCMMGVAWHLKAPVIALSSCNLMPWHYNRVGNPHIPSFVPSLFVHYADKMTFFQRLNNFIDVNAKQLIYSYFIDDYIDVILKEQFGENIPSITDLKKTTSLMFVNSHYSLSGSKPLSPAVIELGGIHIRKSNPIDPTLKEFLDNAVEGVIYVSWGSMIKADTLPDEKRESFVKAFATVKQKILWKWENETLINKPANVYIHKWLQQREILCHKNVLVFVTHAGLLSSSETAHCGTAVVTTPMFGDQFLNSASLINRGMGAVVHYEDITVESVIAALKIALDPTTQENAKKVSYSFNNRINTPMETAIWWVEHVAATEGALLTKSNSVFLPWFIYYSFDVYAFLLAGVITALIICGFILKWCVSGTTKLKTKTN